LPDDALQTSPRPCQAPAAQGSVIGAGLVAWSIFLTYRYAHRIGTRIRPTRMTVPLQLSAFITLCIGVAISWTRIRSLLGEFGIGR